MDFDQAGGGLNPIYNNEQNNNNTQAPFLK
jgi:hypothetical protein